MPPFEQEESWKDQCTGRQEAVDTVIRSLLCSAHKRAKINNICAWGWLIRRCVYPKNTLFIFWTRLFIKSFSRIEKQLIAIKRHILSSIFYGFHSHNNCI